MSSVAEANDSPTGSRTSSMLDRIDYRLAMTPADRLEIYRLRYRAYLNEGAISPNDRKIVTDRFDDLPNSWIIGVYRDGELASSLRISVASQAHPETPSTDVFADVLKPELDAGKTLVDPTRFVADPRLAGRVPELAYMTVRLAYVACTHFAADIGLATVRQEHQAFYRKVFMHRPVGEPRVYPGLIKPICLMMVDFAAKRDKVFARYPFLQSSEADRFRLFGPREAESFDSRELSRASIVPHH